MAKMADQIYIRSCGESLQDSMLVNFIKLPYKIKFRN